MSTRTIRRPVVPEPPTEAEARLAMESHVSAHLALTQITNHANKLIENVRSRAAQRSADHAAEFDRTTTVLMRYAEAHPELFKDARKWEVYGGHKIGWQTSPPAVTLIRPTGTTKKQSWKGFVDTCKKLARTIFVRTVDEPDKEAVLEHYRIARAQAEAWKDPTILTKAEEELAEVGVAVTQVENFVVDLNLDKPAQATPAPAESTEAAASIAA